MDWTPDKVIDRPLNEITTLKRLWTKLHGDTQRVVKEIAEFGWDCEDVVL